jgi:hypothetical protein
MYDIHNIDGSTILGRFTVLGIAISLMMVQLGIKCVGGCML